MAVDCRYVAIPRKREVIHTHTDIHFIVWGGGGVLTAKERDRLQQVKCCLLWTVFRHRLSLSFAQCVLSVCYVSISVYNREKKTFFFSPSHSSPFCIVFFFFFRYTSSSDERERENTIHYRHHSISTFFSLSLSAWPITHTRLSIDRGDRLLFFRFATSLPLVLSSCLCGVYRSLYLSVLFEFEEAEILFFPLFSSPLPPSPPPPSLASDLVLVVFIIYYFALLRTAVERRHQQQQLRMETAVWIIVALLVAASLLPSFLL